MSTGKISTSGQQHVAGYRKVLLRKRMLRWVRNVDGAAYVPFVGDGDIAAELYTDRTIYAADLDPERVTNARMSLALAKSAQVIVADCDMWPFPGLKDPIAVADFDAYSDPWTSFRSFWSQAPKADRLVIIATDGHRQGLMRTGHWHLPDGSKRTLVGREKGRPFYAYFSEVIEPWFQAHVEPWRVVDRWRYLRGMELYCGFCIERPS